MYIEWKDAYRIGVPRIDEQHQQLIVMINALYERIGPGTKPQDVWDLLEGLNQYADTHFATEERIARESNVPPAELAAHQTKHESYRDRMVSFRQALEQKDKHAPVQLMAFISTWWLTHILVEDMELGYMIREYGTGDD